MPHPRISLVHPIANPNSRQAALALWESNLLHEVITTVAYNQNDFSRYLSLLPKKARNKVAFELGRRIWEAPDGFPIQTYPWKEIARVALMRTGLHDRLGFDYLRLINWVCSSLDLHAAKHHLYNLDAVYAYEDGAVATFNAAKQQGILCLYELPILFHRMSREIQSQEAECFPDLASALQLIHEPAWRIERKEQEVQIADHIFVASSITKKSLLDAGVTSEKVSVIPYGAPIEYFQPQPKTDRLFRALFVGSISPRKGIHYLLQAWKELHLSDAELLLVGANCFPEKWLERYEDIFHHVPSVPHTALNQYYSSASVFVFPSLVEGFGLVLLEAMACGIPVITTPNTAGPDILTDGIEGFIVPIRDVETLKEKLEWCYSHPQELAQMGQAARRKAEQLTWELYRQKLASRVQELLHKRTVN
jgi:glycosyltransferase involved in cell wall biosynthesis